MSLNTEKKRILVTGGTGYIGSHTVVELQNSGFEVVIIDNLSNSSADFVDRIRQITGTRPLFEQADLRNPTVLDDFFSGYTDIAGIIHFAAFKSVSESVARPLDYYENNVTGLINLLRQVEKHGIRNFIFSSSCTVYGQPETLPVDEDTPWMPAASPYGNTKQIGESILKDVTISRQGLNVIALRYFNPVGAHSSTLIGELPHGIPNNLMPYITQTSIGIRKHLQVFGNDYSTPDGTAIRDYIHVVDLAKAHVAALSRLLREEQESGYKAFNIGSGKGHSVLEIIHSFEKVSGQTLNRVFAPRREGDIEQIWADVSLANRELGWKAQFTLDDMTRSSWEWEKKLMAEHLKSDL